MPVLKSTAAQSLLCLSPRPEPEEMCFDNFPKNGGPNPTKHYVTNAMDCSKNPYSVTVRILTSPKQIKANWCKILMYAHA